jgi:hypothetical protein
MNKGPRSIVLAAAALVGLPVVMLHCNVEGSSPNLLEAGSMAEEPTEPAGDDTTTETDDSSTTELEAGPVAEAGASKDAGAKDGGDGAAANACVVPEGGAACTPHSVACGASPCTTPADQCCANGFTSGAPNTGSTCSAVDASCGILTTAVACDEAADCPSGQVCCETPAGLGPGTQLCASSCASGSYQLCRSNTECGSAKCTPQSCGIPSYNVEACGMQSGCTAN